MIRQIKVGWRVVSGAMMGEHICLRHDEYEYFFGSMRVILLLPEQSAHQPVRHPMEEVGGCRIRTGDRYEPVFDFDVQIRQLALV